MDSFSLGLHQPTKNWHHPNRQEIIVVDDGSEPPLQQLFQNDEKRLDQDPGTLTMGGTNPWVFQICFSVETGVQNIGKRLGSFDEV